MELKDRRILANPVQGSGSNLEHERLWSPKEVADYLGVSEKTALRHMRSGVIRSRKVGRLWRARPEDVRLPSSPPDPFASPRPTSQSPSKTLPELREDRSTEDTPSAPPPSEVPD